MSWHNGQSFALPVDCYLDGWPDSQSPWQFVRPSLLGIYFVVTNSILELSSIPMEALHINFVSFWDEGVEFNKLSNGNGDSDCSSDVNSGNFSFESNALE